MENNKIEIFFPNTDTENPIWEYNNVTGYITIPPISMENFINLIKNKTNCKNFPEIIHIENFSQKHDTDLKDGRAEQTVTSGGSKSKRRRSKRIISKKSCKRRK